MQRTAGSLAFWLPGEQWKEPAQLPPLWQRDSVTAVMEIRRQLRAAQEEEGLTKEEMSDVYGEKKYNDDTKDCHTYTAVSAAKSLYMAPKGTLE